MERHSKNSNPYNNAFNADSQKRRFTPLLLAC
jgi:hypothetical protein